MANNFHVIEGVARLPGEGCNSDEDLFVQETHPNHRPSNSWRKIAPVEHKFPVQNIFIPSSAQSQIAQDRKLSPAELARLSQKMGPSSRSCTSIVSRKISITTVSTKALTEGQDPTAYRSEADFLVENQHQFSDEDLTAVLVALAEESKMDETRRQQERESIKLAQALVSSDIEEIPTRKRVSSSDDMAAMVVALRAELEEAVMVKKNEEKSFRAACLLMDEETKMSGVDHSCGSFYGEEKDDCSGCGYVHCQACHFEIERKESARELECGHKLHAFCINRYWLTMKKSDCPFCRRIMKQFQYR